VGVNVLETSRLVLRHLTLEDAPFILTLVNDPDFIRFIGDKKVRSLHDARHYLLEGPIASYRQHGFGLYLTSLQPQGTPIGMCGLLKREELEYVDVGFAFLPPFRSHGYATESVAAVLEHARAQCSLRRIVAIVSPDNARSKRVLEKLGFAFERTFKLGNETTEIDLLGRLL
jgi:RimJ/RimL family protein N-acetyltransferase